VIKTLHMYIARDLVKVGLLALIGFTLVMTVFGVIEPMRKQGMAPRMVVTLFGYTLPVMLSLTLPIASLLATTMVYGRFSQDRELLACRASGISTMTLLKPAFVLGALVTVASLLLHFMVAPYMAAMGAQAAREDIRDILYHKLRTRGSFRYGKFTIHADYVDPVNNAVGGIVVVQSKGDETTIFSASMAKVRFGKDEKGDRYAMLYLRDPTGMRVGSREKIEQKDMLGTVPLTHVIKEDPSWYNWSKLLRTLRNPVENADVRRALGGIRRLLTHDVLADRVTKSIRENRTYQELGHQNVQYAVRAASAVRNSTGQTTLKAIDAANRPDPLELASWPAMARLAGDSLMRVQVIELRDGQVRKIVTGDSGKIIPEILAGLSSSRDRLPQRYSARTIITLEISDNVSEEVFSESGVQRLRHQRWVTGRSQMPADIRRYVERIDLVEMYREPEKFTVTKAIHRMVENIKTRRLPRLIARIQAELHSRAAYCLSCFLLVCIGAALGVIFRGGQLVSAFALAVAPAAVVIVVILMGKEMIRNPSVGYVNLAVVEVKSGIVVIWTGLAGLLAITVFIYARLMRR